MNILTKKGKKTNSSWIARIACVGIPSETALFCLKTAQKISHLQRVKETQNTADTNLLGSIFGWS